MGYPRSVVQQIIRACSSPGQNYNTDCPTCARVGSDTWTDKKAIVDLAYVCPSCGNNKGDFMFKECHPAKVVIAGSMRYFCVTALECNDCQFRLWGRVRISARCGKCKMPFDYAMNPECICNLKGEEPIRHWRDLGDP